MKTKKHAWKTILFTLSAAAACLLAGCIPMAERVVYDTEQEFALVVDEETEVKRSAWSYAHTDAAVKEPEPDADTGPWSEDRSCSRGFTYMIMEDGTCAITGMGRNADALLMLPSYTDEGRLVSTVTDKAFYGCGTARTVFIPKTLTEIGEQSFSGCLHLSWFSVEPDNPAFVSVEGVLFSRDMSVLICYPAGRQADTYVIPASVREIAPLAFFACDSLTGIGFEGSREEWSRVRVGYGNDLLTDGREPKFTS